MDLIRPIVTRLVIIVLVVVIEEEYRLWRPSKQQHRGMVDESSQHNDERTTNVNLLRIILGIVVAALPVSQPRNRNLTILYIFLLVSNSRGWYQDCDVF